MQCETDQIPTYCLTPVSHVAYTRHKYKLSVMSDFTQFKFSAVRKASVILSPRCMKISPIIYEQSYKEQVIEGFRRGRNVA